ncbi:hypothetical protein [Lacticaseibacillus jixiensis]|uniref:hypothetical protein n=1 Tax=Lacticaseibacillus jixiensis TaxID=3231926 RepID=UPI0036F32E29
MRKTIVLKDKRTIDLAANGRTPYIYHAAFNADFLRDVMRISKIDPKSPDMQLVYRMSWVFAKSANGGIKNLSKWLDDFDEFPLVEMVDILPVLIQHVYATPLFTNKNHRR